MSGVPPRRAFRRDSDNRPEAVREIDEELEAHLDMVAEELVEEGWPASDARAEAQRRFGNLNETRDYCARQSTMARTQERWTMWWDTLRQDIRYSFRTLTKAPTYALVVVITLAAAIGANTTVFSLMNPYLFRPLPYSAPDGLVQLGGIDPIEGWDGGRFSIQQIQELTTRVRSVESAAGYYYGGVNLTGTDQAEALTSSWFWGDMFGVLGVQPLIGRPLAVSDMTPGAADVVVISESFWERRYARDPGVLGTTIELDGLPRTVVGVAARDFAFPFGGLSVWLPVTNESRHQDRADMVFMPVARLMPGASRDAVEAESVAALAEMARSWPDADGRYDGVSVKGLRESLNFAWSILPIAFGLLLGAVSFVLVIACVNVASLTLARAGGRNREVAVRAAVGADRSRLVRQLITEGFVLASIGGIGGVLIAWLATGLINDLLPADLYRVGDVSLDGRVLAFTALVTLSTPFLFGLLPAWNVSRLPLAATLKEGGRSGGNRQSLRSRRVLVVAEVSLAIVLVTGTGLMIRSLREITRVDTGFDAGSALSIQLTPPNASYDGPDALAAYFDQTAASLAALADVQAVGVASHLPLNHETIPVRYSSSSTSGTEASEWPGAYTSRVDGGFFSALAIELRSGRVFGPEDNVEGESVIVSAQIADRLWPNGDALGQTLLFGSGGEADAALRGTIVGIVADIRYDGLQGAIRPHVYRPITGSTTRRRFVVARTRGEPIATVQSVREAVRAVDADVPPEIRPMGDVLKESTLLWSISSAFLGVFGLVALGLAALGIYGVIAFSVAQRRQEMGLRMALGADGAEIQRAVITDGLKLTGVGLAIGMVLAIAGGTALNSVLYGVSATDPATLIGVLAIFTVVATGASAIPARRAARTDPLRVLRDE